MRANPQGAGCHNAGQFTRPMTTDRPDRKTLIADAAIALLASAGARGLTHRAVDQQAGLPTGSTSFYCRSRLELLTLALTRHGELDMADLAADGRALAARWRAAAAGTDPTTVSALPGFIDSLAQRIATWLSPAGRDRLVARFELFLIASHEPELAPVVQAQRQRFRDAAVGALTAMGVADAVHLAPALLMTVDGLLLAHVTRFVRRLRKRFDLHAADPKAHEGAKP